MGSFNFKGIDSSPYLILETSPSIFKAAKDIKKIEVDGRDGFLTQDLGSYKGVIKPVVCTIKNLSQIDFICSWLDGGGDIIFSNEPTKVYKATIINQIEFSRVIKTFHRFMILFECQPHKYTLTNNMITYNAPGSIINPGAASKPVIKVYGTGNITLTIGAQTFFVFNVSGYVTVDSYLENVYKDLVSKNTDSQGNFPLIPVGTSVVSWVGTCTKVEITPNYRNI